MGSLAGVEERFAAGLADVLAEVGPFLDERQRRLLLGSAARQIGHGGIVMIASATGAAADTIGRGAAELAAGGRAGWAVAVWSTAVARCNVPASAAVTSAVAVRTI